LYTISYLQENDTITVGGFLDIKNGNFQISKPIIMFKDSITSAFEKARSEVGGKSMMVFFSIIALVTAYLAF